MKKRNRSRRGTMIGDFQKSWWNAVDRKVKREHRAWIFEQLEERNLFSATPTGLEGLQWYTVSNDTAQGQQLIDSLAQMWAEQTSTSSAGQGASQSADSGSQSADRFVAYSVPNDPYLQYQWHLFNVGQNVTPGQINDTRGVPGEDINVIPAWDLGYTGAGVNVAVVDDGVQLNHPDLAANISLAYAYDAITDRPGGGNLSFDSNHGTAVAGLVAAVGNNGQGSVGVAYEATIIPIKFLGSGGIGIPSGNPYVNSVLANGAPVDIYNNSWGPNRVLLGRSVYGPTPEEFIALTNSARFGRDGLGAIHVFSSGNDAEMLASAGSNGFVNSRYTIGVGMVDHDGQVANQDGTTTGYGNLAPSVLIVAPSASGPTDILNDVATGSGIFTTDRTDPQLGYNVPPIDDVNFDIDLFEDDDYTSRFGGTSASAPLVSGVIALMLEANPNLTWRDVQEILVRSARQNNDLDESWVTNLVPLFRDPFAGGFGYGDIYPNDGDPWNDVPVYQIVGGVELEPPKQAEVGNFVFDPDEGEFVFVSGLDMANTTLEINATAGGPWDGWVGNNLELNFRSAYGEAPEAIAEIISGKLRVTVYGEGVTWQQIADEIVQLGFDVNVDSLAVFDPTDEAIRGFFSGGFDAVVISGEGEGEEAMLQLNPQYFGYHPIVDPITNPEPKSLFTNGAGYTVSHGRGGTAEYGWAHGVVNAELAVQLAMQWHSKGQNLPNEKTYLALTTPSIDIRAAETTNEESGEFVIPGALSNATDGFAEYFDEFFKEPTIEAGEEGDPDADPPTEDTPDRIDPTSLPFGEDDPPINTRGTHIEFSVPAVDVVTGGSNVMSVEWVEVQLNITGDADAFDFLRVTLVSPDGTHSELTLNQYRPDDIQFNFQSMASGGLLSNPAGSITATDENGTADGALSWVYSTNRHWGERSDSRPVFDEYGNLIDFKNWELHFENYSRSDLDLNSATIVIHGSPVGSAAAPVERVMGKVGVDSGRFMINQGAVVGANDKEFNFDRYVTVSSPNSSAFNSPNFNFGDTPFGEHEVRVADPTQEDFAGNVTVYAIDNATGLRVAEFVTGYDGNYYFDLPAGEYTLGVEDPLGREALNNDNGYRNYDNEWVITVDGEDPYVREAGMIDEVTGKFQYLNNVNFLLNPGSVPVGEVLFTGDVIGDLNGNGQHDAQDAGVTEVQVFADLNHTGKFEPGEPNTYTDSNGHFELPVATGTPNTFSITVVPPATWISTSPTNSMIVDYARPGDIVDGLKFLVKPPSSPSGTGNGNIFGFVFDDRDGDGIQDVNEKGLGGFTVYLDANLNGEFDDGETYTLTSATGSYQFGNVLGEVRVDVVVNDPYVLTSPKPLAMQDVANDEGWYHLNLTAGQVSSGNVFALQNLAINDFGDLIGAGFDTANAWHFVSSGFRLGASVDSEVQPRYIIRNPDFGMDDEPEYIIDPDVGDGEADDADVNEANFDDEDGVELLGGVLRPGANTFSISVTGVGGYLQGWIDWNNDGSFGAGEQIITNADLLQGTHQIVVNAPVTLLGGQKLAARFRWGSIDKSFTGGDSIGEMEDYYFDTKVPILGDYNADDVVDHADYQLWKSTFGSTTDLRADGNKDGRVDAADYSVWRDHMGTTGSGSGGGAALVATTLSSPEATSSPLSIVTVPLGEESLVAPSLIALGEGPATVVSSAVRIAADPVIDLSTTASGSTSGGAAIDLVSLQFSTSVGHTFEAAAASHSFAGAAARADLAMLLLATGNLRSDRTQDGDELSADLQWLNADEDQDAELELALAAAFEEEIDWRGVA